VVVGTEYYDNLITPRWTQQWIRPEWLQPTPPSNARSPTTMTPLARTVQYVPLLNILIIALSNGGRIALPIEDVPALSKATKNVLQNCELLGRGTAINFPDIGVALPIEGIIEGAYGKSRWMAKLGQKDESAKTPAKSNAASSNGKKG
jgi:Protein of unknown function (DUF2442)